ncbi:hypothetical protein CRE_29098 [Caenorhabditis remanei]|uniref:Uncharacterized protein n=1 Tax=Caenorhabditis remanei TaxID=31234 RepID=E3N4I3_CAERE|nr:hypothetical protein CRE_29098 [Caenorhabditis remanei]
MHHAAAPFTSDRPIPVHYYANELNRFVQGIVPDATQEQIKTIESIAMNVKASQEYSQQKVSFQINELEEKMKQKENENEELKSKLNRLEKKFEHMKIEKDLYEYNAVCNDQYENYITQLKKDFKEKMEMERDNFKRSCSNASEKIKELKSQVSQLERKVKSVEKDCREGNSDSLAEDASEKKEDIGNGNPEVQKMQAENANLRRINQCAEKKIDMLNETIEVLKKKISRNH